MSYWIMMTNNVKFSHKSIIERVFSKPGTRNLIIQLFRYFIVGGIAFIVDFGLLVLFTEKFDIPYLTSACLSFIAGLTVNYFLSIVWVFDAKEGSGATRLVEFILFTLVGIIGLGLNALIMWTLTDLLLIHYLISKITSTLIVFAWNFIARRIVVNKIQIVLCKKMQINHK